MHYQIEKSGCNVFKGLVQIRYDLFWGENDPEYALIEVPIIPDEGYTGEETEEAYQAWLASLPTQLINPSICGRIVYFDPSVTDEEILFVGELALDIAEKFLRQGINEQLFYRNLPFNFNENLREESQRRIDGIMQIDFTQVPNAELYRVK